MAKKLKNPTINIEVELTENNFNGIEEVLKLGAFEAKMSFVDFFRENRDELLDDARISVRLPRGK